MGLASPSKATPVSGSSNMYSFTWGDKATFSFDFASLKSKGNILTWEACLESFLEGTKQLN